MLSHQRKELSDISDYLSPINVNSGSAIRGDIVTVWRDEEIEKVLIHEIQHAIQQAEGFESGGSAKHIEQNAENYIPKSKREFIKSTQSYLDVPDLNKNEWLRKKAIDLLRSPYDAYMRLAGEAEARATTQRMNMTPEERAYTYPFENYDIPANELIVRSQLRKK